MTTAAPSALGTSPPARDAITRRPRRARFAHLVGTTGLLLIVAVPLANIGNFVFHAVASRALGPASYGALSSLLVLLLAVSVPITAMQVALTSAAVTRREAGSPITLRSMLRRVTTWSLVGALAVTLAAPLLWAYLHLSSPIPVLCVGLFLVPSFVALVPRAHLLAQGRFAPVAVGLGIGVAMRLLVAAVLLGSGGGLVSAIGASVVGEICATAFLLVVARDGFSRLGSAVTLRWRETWIAVAVFSGFWLLAGIDVVVARHTLAPDSAGMYSAAATAARALLFLPQAVALVALPRFAQRDEHQARRALRDAMTLTGLLGAVGILGLVVLRDTVVSILFGAAYEIPASILALLGVASCVLAILNLLVYYRVARGEARPVIPWIGVAVTLVVTALWQGSPLVLAGIFVVTTLLTLLAALARPADSAAGIERRARREPGPWDPPGLDLTVVVPFFNPGAELCRHVDRLVSALREEGVGFEVVAVSDGSTDGSEAGLAELRTPEVRCVRLPENAGKGAALRAGFRYGRGRYLGFIDADGDLDPSLWHPFLQLMRLYEADVVSGSKRHPLSEVHYPPLRRVYSWTYQQLVRSLFCLRVRDTQTGIKLVRREVLADVLPLMREQRFAFDLELFVVARRCGWRRFLEAPVRIDHRFRSTISVHTVARMFLDTLAIAYRLHVLRAYERPRGPATDVASKRDRSLPIEGVA